jgi:hypothetical protein
MFQPPFYFSWRTQKTSAFHLRMHVADLADSGRLNWPATVNNIMPVFDAESYPWPASAEKFL